MKKAGFYTCKSEKTGKYPEKIFLRKFYRVPFKSLLRVQIKRVIYHKCTSSRLSIFVTTNRYAQLLTRGAGLSQDFPRILAPSLLRPPRFLAPPLTARPPRFSDLGTCLNLYNHIACSQVKCFKQFPNDL